MQNLGVLPGLPSSSSAYAINDNGEVVGESGIAGFDQNGPTTTAHAFLWTSGGGMQDLGTLSGLPDSHADAINNLGHVVGDAFDNIHQSAFIWTSSTGMLDLNTLVDSSGTDWTLRMRGESTMTD